MSKNYFSIFFGSLMCSYTTKQDKKIGNSGLCSTMTEHFIFVALSPNLNKHTN